jgi:NAD(P)-dependent dehydrogenase (short-subunit alcohol dehydrogenase family)
VDLGLRDATVVVVGGGRGMGFAAAQCFADDGARVALIGRSIEVLDSAAAQLRDRGSPDAVGVVADTVFDSQREGMDPIAYLPLAQSAHLTARGLTEIGLGVRPAAGAPMQLTRSIAAALTAVDPAVSFGFRSLSEQVDAAIARERILAALSAVFGLLALGLAAIGLYGVTSYSIGRRTQEIGVRMALGARRSAVIALVLRRSMALTAAGLVLGLIGATAVTRYLGGLLFGLTPLDPATFAGVSVLFAVVAALAAWIPARRASRIDPLAALRCD